MKRSTTINRSVSAVLVTAAALPVTGALAAKQTAHTVKSTTKTKTYKGPLVDMRWGPVQAAITVKNKKITKVSITTNPENSRSQFIDDQAVPMLRSEVLQAQSVNINEISGATMTSDAFMQSLQSAVNKAVKAKALNSSAAATQ